VLDRDVIGDLRMAARLAPDLTSRRRRNLFVV
jgi:hypothetical protein